MSKIKGFTIIELIVVIAIIAVLAAIVMVSVTQYMGKAKYAAIINNMNVFEKNAFFYFLENPTALGMSFTANTQYGCGLNGHVLDINGNPSGSPTPAVLAIKNAGGKDMVCYGGNNTPPQQIWCIVVRQMPSGGDYDSYCIDSTGYRGSAASDKCRAATGALCR